MNKFDMTLTTKMTGNYRKANKFNKKRILDEYCKLTKVKRNTAVQRMLRMSKIINPKVLDSSKNHAKRGPKKKFVEIHKLLVKECWKLASEICAERLLAELNTYIGQLEGAGKLESFPTPVINDVKNISLITLKRVIAEFPKTNGRKIKKGKANIYKFVPTKANFGQYSHTPGNIEIDYVEHNGGSSSGRFVISGCYVDICLGWIARSAGLGKNLSSVRSIHEKNSPKIYHQTREYHPDNAQTILTILFEKAKGVHNPNGEYDLSRSRPYKKNDNAHVEQKNNDKIRKLVGYHRYDTKMQVDLLNKLYELCDIYDNFFIPSVKLEKRVKDSKGRTIKKIYDKPKTPYRRLMENKDVSSQVKKGLVKKYDNLSMVDLKFRIDKLGKKLTDTIIS